MIETHTRTKANLSGSLSVAHHLTLLILSLAASMLCMHQAEQASAELFQVCGFVGIALLLAFFAATRLRALGNLVHECCHATLFATRQLNDLAGHLLSCCLLLPYRKYQRDHFSHHRFLRHPGRDADLRRYPRNFGSQVPLQPFRKQVRAALQPQNFFVGCRFSLVVPGEPQVTNFLRMAIAALWFGIFACILSLQGLAATLLLAICLLFFYPLICVCSDISDHAVGLNSADALGQSRNHIPRSRLLQYILYPRNDSYHLVHHLYPKAPTKTLPALHRRLLERNPQYRRLEHSFTL